MNLNGYLNILSKTSKQVDNILNIYIYIFMSKFCLRMENSNLLKSIRAMINNEYGYRNENNTEKKVKN